MPISLVAVGAKVTAAVTNSIINLLNLQGATGVVPTSVAVTGGGATGSVGTYGKVIFSTATAVSINGCFTSTYDNYEIIFDLTTSAAAGLNLTLRLSGTDAITAYDSQRFTAINATAAAAQSLNAANWIGSGGSGIAGATQSGSIKLFSPAVAVATRARIDNNITANPMTTSSTLYIGALLHRTIAAYDGITFTPASGTITGSARIIGYNNL